MYGYLNRAVNLFMQSSEKVPKYTLFARHLGITASKLIVGSLVTGLLRLYYTNFSLAHILEKINSLIKTLSMLFCYNFKSLEYILHTFARQFSCYIDKLVHLRIFTILSLVE